MQLGYVSGLAAAFIAHLHSALNERRQKYSSLVSNDLDRLTLLRYLDPSFLSDGVVCNYPTRI